MLTDLLPAGTSEGTRDYYKYIALAAFLAGGARRRRRISARWPTGSAGRER